MKKKENSRFIVFLVLIFAFVIIGVYFFDETTTSDESRHDVKTSFEEYQKTGKIDWEKEYGDDWEGYLKGELEEEGFEVIRVFVSEDASGYRKISVTMKSLGSRDDQLKEVVYNSALINKVKEYNIHILSPTDKCTYIFSKSDWDSCQYPSGNIDKFLLEDSLLLCE